MSTGKDYGLPEQYADWVKVEMAALKLGGSYVALHAYAVIDGSLNDCFRHFFVPPKPKPTLPEVGVGGVVRYTDNAGDPVRVMRLELGYRETWTDMHQNRYTNAALLADVNSDGFTVELDGL